VAMSKTLHITLENSLISCDCANAALEANARKIDDNPKADNKDLIFEIFINNVLKLII